MRELYIKLGSDTTLQLLRKYYFIIYRKNIENNDANFCKKFKNEDELKKWFKDKLSNDFFIHEEIFGQHLINEKKFFITT